METTSFVTVVNSNQIIMQRSPMVIPKKNSPSKTLKQSKAKWRFQPPVDKVGRFWSTESLPMKSYHRLVEIKDWFTIVNLSELVIPFIEERHTLSLRAL